MLFIDMEMPKTCEECKISRHSELHICPILNTYSTKHSEKRLDNCPIKGELPKGHGDLKDVDKLKHAFIKWSMAVQGNFTDADIASIVCNSPTIIEADRSEEE